MSAVMQEPTISTAEASGQLFPNRNLTYEEFLSEYDGRYVEYVGSEVIGPMTVGSRHNQLTGFLRALLQFFVEVKGVGQIYGEPFQMKMVFADGVHGREPDVFFIKNENLTRLTDRFYDGGADLVIEIVSPDSVVRDTHEKFEEYQAAGVSEYWIIDPRRRTATFYGFDDDGKYQLLPLSDGGRFESRVIVGLWIESDWLWDEPLPNLIDVFKEWGLV